MVIKSYTKMVRVADDWYPCYPQHKVKIELGIWKDAHTKEKNIFFNAWGMDDTGVEKFYWEDQTKIEEVFQEWLKLFNKIPTDGSLTSGWFYEHGFKNA